MAILPAIKRLYRPGLNKSGAFNGTRPYVWEFYVTGRFKLLTTVTSGHQSGDSWSVTNLEGGRDDWRNIAKMDTLRLKR
jgi:hypothetical protein